MGHPIFLSLVGALTLNLLAFNAAAHEDVARPRTVAVSGEGESTVAPDRARLVMAVDRLSADVKSAETEVNAVVRAYLPEARALGAKDEQISTTGLSIQPEYQWNEKERRQQLVGYRLRREVVVLVTNLDKLGDFLLRATKAGVNQVQPPLLESSRAKEVQRQALVRAGEDARAKAQVLCDTLGVKLGMPRLISSQDGGGPPPPMPMKVMAMRSEAFDSGNQEMGIALGEIRYTANVQVEFDLLAP